MIAKAWLFATRVFYGSFMLTAPGAAAFSNGIAMRAVGLKSEFLDEIERRTK